MNAKLVITSGPKIIGFCKAQIAEAAEYLSKPCKIGIISHVTSKANQEPESPGQCKFTNFLDDINGSPATVNISVGCKNQLYLYQAEIISEGPYCFIESIKKIN
ncbi:MAG: hypothetical protein ACXVCY_12015 [Pseudobdellovibrionaceae bacterium]